MGPPEKRKAPVPPEATAATITEGNHSGVVMDMAPASVTIPATAPLRLAVNALAFEREPIHWWLRSPQGAAQVTFLKAMGWWS